ncbi:hypothetical protein UFOVP242_210 [uncultured Caudovirales phage]|uniref:Uncharacterized protein n=1 Tax=uncultured Caudovirales phage TaxID=2100421 RepID=A0A6J7WVI9_9CAUD|nr:hypothetical protein UFOVP242_210 [uncultured Caudovirales phage]
MSTYTLQDVFWCINEDGLDYCFRNYSDWDKIEDYEFHRLVKEYKAAADALESYVFMRVPSGE